MIDTHMMDSMQHFLFYRNILTSNHHALLIYKCNDCHPNQLFMCRYTCQHSLYHQEDMLILYTHPPTLLSHPPALSSPILDAYHLSWMTTLLHSLLA